MQRHTSSWRLILGAVLILAGGLWATLTTTQLNDSWPVRDALARNNYLSALGQTKGSMVSVNLIANTDLRTAALSALDADRSACRRHAERYSWRACAETFVSNLVHIGVRW